ncbi:MAG: Fe-S cluster assembly protein SufD [Acidobacteriota bacterium]|nr:Fe-S cluster assembly protein SufD [Acidobacteriota bacterium]
MKVARKSLDSYLERFNRLDDAASDSPAWLSRLRREAMLRFAETGFPTIADEDWRYTNVARLAATSYETAPAPSPDGHWRTESLAAGGQGGVRCVFLNGRYCAELSHVDERESRVRVGSLASILRECPEEVEAHLARYVEADRHPFVTLNTAFIEDGAVVRVSAGSRIPDPIHLVFLSTGNGGPAFVTHPRNLILVGAGSECSVVEHYLGVGDKSYFSNPVTEVAVGENANLDHYRLQEESPAAHHVSTLEIRQESNSVARTMSADVGGRLTRNDLNVFLGGEGADAKLDGIFVVSGEQLVDNHTRIEHAAPHCGSREIYKGILGDRSRGVFRGRIVVHPGAQKTDSVQTNNNLLLSDRALVNTKPQLEIYADEVKCTHGATIGQLDQEAIFYMRSRGIDEDMVRSILTYGFAEDVIRRVRLPGLRNRLSSLLFDRLPQGVFLRKALT